MKQRKSRETSMVEDIRKKFLGKDKNITVGIGDDAAVVKPSKGKSLVYSCDAQVENVHFLTDRIMPEQLGVRAISCAVSDICVMGATPRYVLISLFIPKTTTDEFIKKLYRGIDMTCKLYGITVVGGNISKGSVLSIDVFVTGEVNKKYLLQRSGAKPGDLVCVTGTLGAAHAGYELGNYPAVKLSRKDKTVLETAQFTPMAKINEARIITGLGLATSMIDLSDSLSSTVNHICEASYVGVRIDANNLPINPAAVAFANAINMEPVDLTLQGGEDYEILFTVKPKDIEKIIREVKHKTGTQVTVIGEIRSKEKGATLILPNGKSIPLAPKSWDHFA